MYPHELEQFIQDREYYIGGDDLNKVISPTENPQLNHIKFHSDYNYYEMWDKEGNYYKFGAMPYAEAKEKGLVKKRNNFV